MHTNLSQRSELQLLFVVVGRGDQRNQQNGDDNGSAVDPAVAWIVNQTHDEADRSQTPKNTITLTLEASLLGQRMVSAQGTAASHSPDTCCNDKDDKDRVLERVEEQGPEASKGGLREHVFAISARTRTSMTPQNNPFLR